MNENEVVAVENETSEGTKEKKGLSKGGWVAIGVGAFLLGRYVFKKIKNRRRAAAKERAAQKYSDDVDSSDDTNDDEE